MRGRTTVRRMQDRELVAAIVAGGRDGLAEAYDRYAAPLYAYCRLILPDSQAPGEAASAVADTFIIAAVKLQELRDPDQLRSWLHAVARNECLRQLGAAAAVTGATGSAGRPPDDATPTVLPPAGLREQVLKACSDTTPAGRAYRVSVAHRAEPFGRTGFPKPIAPAGPRWWQGARRHPGAVAGVGAMAAAVVAGGIAVLLLTGGPHGAQASTLALGRGGFSTPGAAPGPDGRSSLSGTPAPASGRPAASAPSADGPTADRTASPGASRSPAPRSASPSPSRSPSPSPTP
jgi:hypothetical protein